ncbi:MAG: polysaccharide biosynthesis/export family protein [Bacteroidales bacterium]|jgi:polysaccharide export outer membrane protein|nr:polysaccharide biosynthesis/export family protein [Bacteroidales bacterium]
MTNRIYITAVFFLLLLFGSCGSSKKIAYFQPIAIDEESSTILTSIQHEAVVMPDDVLSIVVSGLDPAAVIPFNLPLVTVVNPTSEKSTITAGTGGGTLQGYLVDLNGNIEFPVLGTLKVGGLKKSEVVRMINEKLQPYLKDPIITVRFMNFRVSVMGEVTRPGSFNIPNEKINMLEALAMAGDLTIFGKRKNILIIRESESGKKTATRIDLTSDEAFRSPFFYLQQNDVIYVEPNKTRITNASSARQNLPVVISSISALASTVAVIIALTDK